MYLIGGGRLITHDSSRPYIENGAVSVDGSSIVKVGTFEELSAEFPESEFIDARGGIIMPGLINAHTHFYSYLGRGFAFPDYAPTTPYEALRDRSWKLDRNLSFYDCFYAAYAGALESIRCGVTTVFDHHAASGCGSGTLMAILGAVDECGLRACLSYEVSQRCGYKACCEGIVENEDFINYCESTPHERIKAMFGLHAPYTLTDFDFKDCVDRNGGRTGFHIHVSEISDDPCICMHAYGQRSVERLLTNDILGDKTIAAHCVHVTPREMDILAESGTFVVNNPQSNLSNAVGCSPVFEMLKRGIPVCLGTDGFTSDMLESAKSFICAQRSANSLPGSGVNEAAKLLFENNRLLASRYFDNGIGLLREGSPADIIILDHKPYAPIDESNYAGHLFFGANGHDCTMTMVGGRILMRDKKLLTVKEDKLRACLADSIAELWKKIKDRDDKPYKWSNPITSYR
ncbi:MAG: putative aminohydrolase SsnA [Clostridia bacterium]|nr:putative aminohydrolase SsnA [Clostridia bacterium]